MNLLFKGHSQIHLLGVFFDTQIKTSFQSFLSHRIVSSPYLLSHFAADFSGGLAAVYKMKQAPFVFANSCQERLVSPEAQRAEARLCHICHLIGGHHVSEF